MPQPAAPAPADPGDEVVGPFLRLVGTGRLDEARQALSSLSGLVNAVGPHPFWGGRPQALHVAIETGRRPVISMLLAAGADVNGRNDGYDLWSPLLLAIQRKRTALVRSLRRRGARVGLVEALALGDDDLVDAALDDPRGTLPPAPNGGSLLMFARTTRAIDRLLARGVAPDTPDRWGATPAEALSRLGRRGRPLVRHLAGHGVPVGPVELAGVGDRAGLVAFARERPGVLVDPQVLVAAVDSRHHGLVAWLLRHGADPNARADWGSRHTALHAAAWNGDLRMIRLLLAHGADRSLRDQEHNATALDWAETSAEVTANARCLVAAAELRHA